jgi:hypothetical protein
MLESEVRKNIRLFQINDKPAAGGREIREKTKVLFS